MLPQPGADEVRVRAVAVCGCGHDGRLGLGPTSPSSSDIVVLLPDFLPQAATHTTSDASCCSSHDNTVVSIHVGGYHTIVCTSDGLYGWGLNECGQLGLGKPATRDEQSVCKPTRLTFFDALYVKYCGHEGTRWQDFVQHVSCGAEHSMVLTSCGLYATGCNQYGQLGLGEDAADTVYEWTLVCASQLTWPRLTGAEEPGAEGNMRCDTTGCMAGGVGRRLLSGAVTAVSCGTHHTLLACSDVLLRGFLRGVTCDETDNNDNKASQEEQAVCRCPVLLLACGKGDFGELGYEGDGRAVQRSRDRRQQRSLQAQLLTQAAAGASFSSSSSSGNAVAEQQATPYSCGPTHKPCVQRRPEFFSGDLRIVRGCDELLALCSSVNTNDTTVSLPTGQTPRVRELRAMHLHSALTLDMHTNDGPCRAETHTTRTYHWGCYYCNAIEDAAASRARLVQPAGWRVHAGNELLLRFAPPEACSASHDLVHVMGSGVLGLGEEDSFEPDWRALQLPVKGESYEVRCVSGRDHVLMLLAQHTDAVHREADSPAQVVLGFGDNLHGQLGRRPAEDNKHYNEEEEEGDDKVVRPVRVLACGDLVRAPHSTQAWQVVYIADAQAGARHSVFLVDLVLRKE